MSDYKNEKQETNKQKKLTRKQRYSHVIEFTLHYRYRLQIQIKIHCTVKKNRQTFTKLKTH